MRVADAVFGLSKCCEGLRSSSRIVKSYELLKIISMDSSPLRRQFNTKFETHEAASALQVLNVRLSTSRYGRR